MGTMPGFTPLATEQHLEALKARLQTVTTFVVNMTAIIDILIPSKLNRKLWGCASSFDQLLNFDTERSIAILTEQFLQRPKQIIQQLAQLTAQRDLYEGQMKIFQDSLASAKSEHQEVINALAPLLNLVGQVLGNSLQGVNQEIARLQVEIEKHDRQQAQT